MLILDMGIIGNKLFAIRKKAGMTQEEVAEAAELSLRTYADVERGCVNMRVETILRICKALNITPDEIFTQTSAEANATQEEIMDKLSSCRPKEKEAALKLLKVYLQSIENQH